MLLSNEAVLTFISSCNKTKIYFWNKILHVSDGSSVHHQEFITVHTAMIYVIQVC